MSKVSIRMITKEVIEILPQALHDDPTAFPDPASITREEIAEALDTTGRDMIMSTVRSRLGKQLDAFVQAVDVEWKGEDAWGDYEHIINDLLADPINAEPAAETIRKVWGGLGKDWEAKLDTAKTALRMVADELITTGLAGFVVDEDMVTRYVQLRPDLEKLMDEAEAEAQAYYESLNEKNAEEAGSLEHLVASLTEDAVAEPAGSIDWDDDDEPGQADPPPAETPAPPEPAPVLDALVSVGFDAKEIASLLGVSGSFVSMVRTGKRPFPALKDHQRAAFLEALEKRRVAIEDLAHAIAAEKI